MVDAGAVPSNDDGVKDKECVSISLKHYMPKHECFSSWTQADLKKFSSIVRKLRKLSPQALSKTNLCSKLSNQGGWGLPMPSGVDKELDVYELRLAQGEDVRIFGVMVSSVFYLIWLDRNHAVCG